MTLLWKLWGVGGFPKVPASWEGVWRFEGLWGPRETKLGYQLPGC